MDARRLYHMRWTAWFVTMLCACMYAHEGRAGDANASLSAERACALTNRIERLRTTAMANAYYLRSAYLRRTATHAAASGREMPDAKTRILDAIMLLGRAVEHDNSSTFLWWEYATLNASVGNAANVVNAYEHLAAIQPEAGMLAKLGSMYEMRGEPDRAVAVYKRALRFDASNIVVRERIVDVYVEQGLRSTERGDIELGREQLRHAMDELNGLGPTEEHGRRAMKKALLFELLGDEDAALKAYHAVRAIDPDDPEPIMRASKIHFARAERLQRTGRAADAAAQFVLAACMATNAVAARLDKPELLNYTAYAMAMADIDLSLADKLVRDAIARDEANGAYIDTLGWITYRRGAFDEALKLILRARELEGDDPVIMDHLGDIYLSLGQHDKARAMWEHSLRLDGENQQVRDKLKTCGVPPK